MRTTMRGNGESSTRAGASDKRSGPTRTISNPNPQSGAAAAARAAYTRPVRPMPVYQPPPPPPRRTESALDRMQQRANEARETVRNQISNRSRSIVPMVNNFGRGIARAASNAHASVRDRIAANRRPRNDYRDGMAGGQGSTRVLAFDDIAADNGALEPAFVPRAERARDAFADSSSTADPSLGPEPARTLHVNEAALAALEGRPAPVANVIRQGIVNAIDRARARHRDRTPAPDSTPPPPPPPAYTPPPEYRSCLSSGRPSAKDVSFEDNHDRRVTMWDMAAPDLNRTPEQSPTEAGPSTPTASAPLSRRPPPNLNKPVPDSPESETVEWPETHIALEVALGDGYVSKEEAAAVRAKNPHGRHHFIPTPAGWKPS